MRTRWKPRRFTGDTLNFKVHSSKFNFELNPNFDASSTRLLSDEEYASDFFQFKFWTSKEVPISAKANSKGARALWVALFIEKFLLSFGLVSIKFLSSFPVKKRRRKLPSKFEVQINNLVTFAFEKNGREEWR